MAVSALDSRIFRNLFGTQEVRDIFTDDAYVGFLVEVEAALARAEAAVGVIPASAGEAITNALAKIDLEYDFPSLLDARDSNDHIVSTAWHERQILLAIQCYPWSSNWSRAPPGRTQSISIGVPQHKIFKMMRPCCR